MFYLLDINGECIYKSDSAARVCADASDISIKDGFSYVVHSETRIVYTYKNGLFYGIGTFCFNINEIL